MADIRIAAAREQGKMNSLFSLPHAGDAAAERPASSIVTSERSHHHAVWEALWADGSFLPWDRQLPHPALHDALISRRDMLGDAFHDPGSNTPRKDRRRALVPGCGRGCDVFQLRSFGYDVLGIDVSITAVAKAAELEMDIAARGKTRGSPVEVGYGVKDPAVGMGVAEVKAVDFFGLPGQFDLIFDYTV